MIFFRLSLFSIVFALSAFSNLAAPPVAGTMQGCLNYEPAEVALEGASDQKEVVWILRLAKPVCVKADEGSDFNVERSRVTDVQLVLEADMFAKYRGLLGKRVRAMGTLFGEHTAHHFTPILLDVTAVDLLR
jgi:hypothetical protein